VEFATRHYCTINRFCILALASVSADMMEFATMLGVQSSLWLYTVAQRRKAPCLTLEPVQLNEFQLTVTFQLTDAIVNAGLMRSRRVEVHPKVAGQPLGAVLQTVIPRLQDKQLKTDKIQNAENAIADMVSKGEAFAGMHSFYFACTVLRCTTAELKQTLGIVCCALTDFSGYAHLRHASQLV